MGNEKSRDRSKGEEVIKKMASLLRSGATLLSYTCPACGSPLFRLKSGEVMCPKCNKRVFIVKSEIEERRVYLGLALERLEKTVLSKIEEINSLLTACDISDLDEKLRILIDLLEILERVIRMSERVG